MNTRNTEILLSIIVVSYNTKTLTIQTIEAALTAIESSELLRSRTELIVVDNNSSDDSVAALSKLATTATAPIKILENTTNSGFAAANNQAIAHAHGTYIFLLNSDTIIEPTALEKLVSFMEETAEPQSTAVLSSERTTLDAVGIVAATLLNLDGSVQPQGGSLPTLWTVFFQMSLLDDLPVIGKYLPSTQHTGNRHVHTVEQRPYKMGWVGGTAMLLRRSMLDEIGLLDEHIFMYGEDIELCMRAASHHYDVAILPTATVTHLQSQSGSSERALLGEFTGYLYIWSKHKPLWQLPLLRAILWWGCFVRICTFSIMGKTAAARTYYKIATAIRKDQA